MSRIGNLKYGKGITIRHLGLIDIYKIGDKSTVDIKYIEDDNLVKDLVTIFTKYGFNNIIEPYKKCELDYKI